MKAMMKLEAQLEIVESAIPFARARSGKISAPSNQGVGPQLVQVVSAVRISWQNVCRSGDSRSAKNEKIDADGSKDAICGRNTGPTQRERVGVVL